MEHSKIQWCDHTFNPWIGCTKVSPGCANCYAEGESKRRGWAQWGKGKERHRTSEPYWKQPLKWNASQGSHQDFMNGTAERPRVFCASLADWLDDEVPIEWLMSLLTLMETCRNLDWLLLTKRPENWEKRLTQILDTETNHVTAPIIARNWIRGVIPQNLWIGTSVEDQKRADERIPLLLQIPAKIRFLSCEPLLGIVTLHPDWLSPCSYYCDHQPNGYGHHPEASKLHWVIIGGESGPHARPCNIGWISVIVAQCKMDSVPVFVKQLGTRPHLNGSLIGNPQKGAWSNTARLKDRKGGDPNEWPEDLRIREFPKP